MIGIQSSLDVSKSANHLIGTLHVEDLPILWNEIGLWEPIGMKKSLEVVKRKYFLFAEQKCWLSFLDQIILKKIVLF